MLRRVWDRLSGSRLRDEAAYWKRRAYRSEERSERLRKWAWSSPDHGGLAGADERHFMEVYEGQPLGSTRPRTSPPAPLTARATVSTPAVSTQGE